MDTALEHEPGLLGSSWEIELGRLDLTLMNGQDWCDNDHVGGNTLEDDVKDWVAADNLGRLDIAGSVDSTGSVGIVAIMDLVVVGFRQEWWTYNDPLDSCDQKPAEGEEQQDILDVGEKQECHPCVLVHIL